MRVTSSPAACIADRKALRTALRARRRGLPLAQRRRSAQLVAANVDLFLRLRPSWRIALYASLPEELDTGPLIRLAQNRGCRIFLPRIARQRLARGMRFIETDDRHRLNRLGIHEPQSSRAIGARWLDLVFLPLVGFDSRGVRLGTGGGYYDRAFAFRRWRQAWHTPRLIGLGYAFQQVPSITSAPHDVLLDAVVTEEGIIRCSTG